MMETILWDVDDVLNNVRRDWFLFMNNDISDYKSIDYNEVKKHLFDFKLYHSDKITVNKDILSWFKKYGDNFNHIILTDVSIILFPITVNFIIKYFSEFIQSYNFVSSNKEKNKLSQYLTKSEFIQKHFKKIDYFIDDSIKNCEEVKSLGIKAFCPKQPWNNGQNILDILGEIK